MELVRLEYTVERYDARWELEDWKMLRSVCTWRAGEAAPRIAVEVVSENDPRKDYSLAPEKHAASGAKELWVFDPLLAGPGAHGGPHRLQLWRRTARGLFRRVYAGAGPALSRELGAWLVPLETPEGWMLRIANDAGGRDLWLTGEERERAEKERERAEKERERAEKNAMEQRVKELEAELARLGGRPKRR